MKMRAKLSQRFQNFGNIRSMRYPQRKVAEMQLIWPKEEIISAAGSRAGGRGLPQTVEPSLCHQKTEIWKWRCRMQCFSFVVSVCFSLAFPVFPHFWKRNVYSMLLDTGSMLPMLPSSMRAHLTCSSGSQRSPRTSGFWPMFNLLRLAELREVT